MLAKKKRVSKKSKSSWRKHVNINDVEDFLEEKRFEERLGPPLSTLPNEELFTLDTKPQESEQPTTKNAQRKKLLLQDPKCFTILKSHSKVPDPITKRNRVRTKEERKNEIIKKIEASNLAKGILKPREVQAVKDRKATLSKKEAQPKRGDFNLNLWGDEQNSELEKNEWLATNTKKHTLAGTGKKTKTVRPPPKKNTSILPTIEIPHPGMSYNPSFEDHQALLKQVTETETKLMKEEAHLNRVTKQMFSKVTETKRDSDWLQEMSQGLPNEPKIKSEEESDNEYKAINPPVKNKKKTLKQKRKQREQREMLLKRRSLKQEKKKTSDMHQLKTLHKRIGKTEHKSAVLREKRKTVKLLKASEPKRLGSNKFEEPDLDFNLGQDISGNLLNLKREGNPLSERFKSLQKRNIVQPSVVCHKKRSKVKKYTRPGFKEDWKSTVAR